MGGSLKQLIMLDTRFYPVNVQPGEIQVFRKAKNWQEGAALAKESCQIADASRSLNDNRHSLQDNRALGGGGGGHGKGGGGKGGGGGRPDPAPAGAKACSCCGAASHTKKSVSSLFIKAATFNILFVYNVRFNSGRLDQA